MAMPFKYARGKIADVICRAIAPEFVIINKDIDPFAEALSEGKNGIAALCAKYLVGQAIRNGADYIRVEFEGYTIAGVECGDWHLEVKKISEVQP